jgi:hypothetical protein
MHSVLIMAIPIMIMIMPTTFKVGLDTQGTMDNKDEQHIVTHNTPPD